MTYPPMPQPIYPSPIDPQALFDGAHHPDDLARPLYGASFADATKRFFRQYATFTGRASRSEYWWAYLLQSLIALVPALILGIGWILVVVWAATADYGSGYGYSPSLSAAPAFGVLVIGAVLTGLVWLGLLVPQLAITWRRLHDANYAGPMYFLSLIPSVGSLILLIFTVLPSKPEGRRFDLPR